MHFSQSAQLRDACLCLGEESAGSLEFIVILRPVKSRILWVQMLGRGTRKCPELNKTKFVVFDCFDGTLIQYFKNTTDFEIQPPTKTPLTLPQVIENIWQNVDRDHNDAEVQAVIAKCNLSQQQIGESFLIQKQLVPQNPSDEPAEKFLERIQTINSRQQNTHKSLW